MKLKKVTCIGRKLLDFDDQTNYFELVDTICLLFHQRPPITKRTVIKVTWLMLSVLHGLQYLGFTIQMVRRMNNPSKNVSELTTIINMLVLLGVSVVRGLCLAINRNDLVKLKNFVNSKSCQRYNNAAFEQRKNTYKKINKFLIVYYSISVTNAVLYSLTSGYHEDVFRIPYLLERVPERVALILNVCIAILHIPWCCTVWYSATQLLPLMFILRTELRIIIDQFKYIYEEVAVNHVLQSSDIILLTQEQKTQFIAELSARFENALAYHSEFIKHLQLFQKTSSMNFCILFIVGAVIITVNTGMFILEPSIEQLPLLTVSIQFTTEIYCYCTMLQNLENENNRISQYIYGLDWINALGKLTTCDDQKHCKSIYKNVLLLLAQVKNGIKFRVGGMFSLDLKTFTDLIRTVYSLLTLMMRTMSDI